MSVLVNAPVESELPDTKFIQSITINDIEVGSVRAHIPDATGGIVATAEVLGEVREFHGATGVFDAVEWAAEKAEEANGDIDDSTAWMSIDDATSWILGY